MPHTAEEATGLTAALALLEQRRHGRRVLEEVAARFEVMVAGTPDAPVLVSMVAALERELRWLLDELDERDEEAMRPV